MPSPPRRRSIRETSPRRDAGSSMLPVIRMQERRHFDAHSGELVNAGTVEIMANVRSEAFVCGGKIRHIKRGCGRNCACITCLATPRRDGMPTLATVETCPCIWCQRRRAGLVRND